jgi:isoaspartyl peptidase/L-asparaginase-like protein (Ntn-hydrolase superfamily)
VTLARHATDLVADGHVPAEAADRAIAEFESITGSAAGLIDAAGRTGEAFNTELMQTAVAGE